MGEETGFMEYCKRALAAVAMVTAAVLLLLFLRRIGTVLLLAFGGVMLAVFLDALARLLYRHTPLGRGGALPVVAVFLLAALGGTGWLLGPQLSDQLAELVRQLPAAVEKIRQELMRTGWGAVIWERLSAAGGADQQWWQRITGVFSSLLGAFSHLFVIVFVGVYLAVNPGVYQRAVVRIVPPRHQRRAADILTLQGHVLRRWLVGRLASMLVVGVLTAVGLWLIGMPLVFSLGLIAGLFSFVPYLGPVLSAVPAVLVALLQGPEIALYVTALYGGIQLVESYMVTPLIQQWAVSVPPAFLIIGQIIAGLLGGLLGVLLATPILVALGLLLQTLYLEDVLGEQVTVLGED